MLLNCITGDSGSGKKSRAAEGKKELIEINLAETAAFQTVDYRGGAPAGECKLITVYYRRDFSRKMHFHAAVAFYRVSTFPRINVSGSAIVNCFVP